MSKWIVDIHGDIEGDYELIKKYEEPKIGHWITKPHVYGVTYCSECDFELKIDNTNYCPNCGLRMEGEE